MNRDLYHYDRWTSLLAFVTFVTFISLSGCAGEDERGEDVLQDGVEDEPNEDVLRTLDDIKTQEDCRERRECIYDTFDGVCNTGETFDCSQVNDSPDAGVVPIQCACTPINDELSWLECSWSC